MSTIQDMVAMYEDSQAAGRKMQQALNLQRLEVLQAEAISTLDSLANELVPYITDAYCSERVITLVMDHPDYQPFLVKHVSGEKVCTVHAFNGELHTPLDVHYNIGAFFAKIRHYKRSTDG